MISRDDKAYSPVASLARRKVIKVHWLKYWQWPCLQWLDASQSVCLEQSVLFGELAKVWPGQGQCLPTDRRQERCAYSCTAIVGLHKSVSIYCLAISGQSVHPSQTILRFVFRKICFFARVTARGVRSAATKHTAVLKGISMQIDLSLLILAKFIILPYRPT